MAVRGGYKLFVSEQESTDLSHLVACALTSDVLKVNYLFTVNEHVAVSQFFINKVSDSNKIYNH